MPNEAPANIMVQMLVLQNIHFIIKIIHFEFVLRFNNMISTTIIVQMCEMSN